MHSADMMEKWESLDPRFRILEAQVRVLVQRVSSAQVEVSGEVVGAVRSGLLLFVGLGKDSHPRDLVWMARKICGLRIFADDQGLMNRDVLQVQGGILAVSQFTLYGDCRKGRRPSFESSLAPEDASHLFDQFVEILKKESGVVVETGVFGADMKVDLVNDGPVTFWLEKETGSDV